jgi:hypothetical protein
MQQTPPPMDERSQLSEKLWTFAQRGVVLLVAVLVGVFIGYQLWGEARQLRDEVARLDEKATVREKERDTLKSQMAIIDRDKKELEKRYEELQAKCTAPTGQPANP